LAQTLELKCCNLD